MIDTPISIAKSDAKQKNAAAGADIAFNTGYLSHVQDDEGVTGALRDRLSGVGYTVRSRYLLCADGARSTIVE